MKILSLAWRFGMLVAGLGSAVARAAPEPHPTRAHRLVEMIDGIRIEYSPGQEKFLQPVAERMVAWNRELEERQAKLAAEAQTVVPLSARDLRENRAAVLQQLAATIGLSAPTELQGRCYDTMLDYYEIFEALATSLPAVSARMAVASEITIWDKNELKERLTKGESIPGYKWNAQTGQVEFEFAFQSTPEPTPEGKALAEKIKAQQLDHSFNYTVDANGVANISATFNLDLREPVEKAAVPSTNRRTDIKARLLVAFAQCDAVCMPVVLSEKNAGKTPAEIAEETVERFRIFAQMGDRVVGYRDGKLAYLVLHETTEVGIVERHIGSSDRRWLCDGTANFVAWKIARDRAGEEFARQVYDLDGQLAQYAALQKQIDLRKWPAVERQPEKDRDTPLTKAHYAFATRAIRLMTQANGEDVVAKLFREVGRTPRSKVTMKTVANAYRKLTGGKLDELISAAEKKPLPAPGTK